MSAPAPPPGRGVVGRLAPTPSGRLHLGNVVAFAGAWLAARGAHGRLLLRIEDVDTTRSRAALEQGIRDDLRWLGLDVDAETPRQSARGYGGVLAQLEPHTYRCTCTRKDLRGAGGVYPGTCRDAGHAQGAVRLRVDTPRIRFTDRVHGPQDVDPRSFGDPVLVRRDGLVAYTLAVVADDIADGVTEVVRGADLLGFTAVQIVLWRLLGHKAPTWLHTPLLNGPDGRKLSKSHSSLAVGALRDAGWTPNDVWRAALPHLGMRGDRLDPAGFDPARVPRGPITVSAPSSPRAPRPT